MNVVFLGDSISTQNTGIHYFGKQLIEQITNKYKDHSYTVISSTELKFKGVKNIVVPISKYIPFHLRLRQLYEIPNLLNKEAPDVVIELAHFGPFRLKPGIKRITVIHDLSPILHREYHNLFSYLAHKLILPNIISSAEYLICNSNTTKRSIEDKFHITTAKTVVVYPRTKPKDTLKDLNLDYEYFLALGTLEPRKNYQNLIGGFNYYKAKGGDKKLVIIGAKGWKTKKIFTAMDSSEFKDDIIYLGYVERELINTYLKNASALVSASLFEGFGLPVLEAMSYTIPLILSDIDVYKEIAGNRTIYFDPLRVEDIGEALFSCQHQERELAEISKERYREISSKEFELPFL